MMVRAARLLMLAGAVTLVTAAGMALPAMAQSQSTSASHLSLAERVTRLEAQQSQGSIGLVNRVQQLQTQVQQLQGQVEVLQHKLEQVQQTSRDRYVDLDSRIARLEGHAPTAGAALGPADTSSAAPMADAGTQDTPIGAAAGTPADEATGTTMAADPEDDYEHAFSALRSGDFASAARRFRAFIQRYPNHKLTPNAYYWLGESYYGTQNYQVALQAFDDLLRRFPDDAKAPDALLKKGYCQFELQQWSAARDTLEQVRSRYPDSREARLAAGRLRALDRRSGG